MIFIFRFGSLISQQLADLVCFMAHALAGLPCQHVSVAISGGELFGADSPFHDGESQQVMCEWQCFLERPS